jgi:hypothetical protein
MRPRLLGILGALAVAGLLAAPVALAVPGQSGWGGGTGQFFDQCTNELVDNTFNVHFVETESGPSHFNVHVVGVGEISGATYVGETASNAFVHAAPDGTFLVDQTTNFRVVGQGGLSNSWITVRTHLVFDANGNVISGRTDFVSGCQGG